MRCMITISDHNNYFSYGLYHLFKSRLEIPIFVKSASLDNKTYDGVIVVSFSENVRIAINIKDKKYIAKELNSAFVIFRCVSINQLISKIEFVISNVLKNGHGFDIINNDIGNVKLTPTQIKICKVFYAGITNKNASILLNISEKTISTHKRNVMRKINVINSQGLYLWIDKNKNNYF